MGAPPPGTPVGIGAAVAGRDRRAAGGRKRQSRRPQPRLRPRRDARQRGAVGASGLDAPSGDGGESARLACPLLPRDRRTAARQEGRGADRVPTLPDACSEPLPGTDRQCEAAAGCSAVAPVWRCPSQRRRSRPRTIPSSCPLRALSWSNAPCAPPTTPPRITTWRSRSGTMTSTSGCMWSWASRCGSTPGSRRRISPLRICRAPSAALGRATACRPTGAPGCGTRTLNTAARLRSIRSWTSRSLACGSHRDPRTCTAVAAQMYDHFVQGYVDFYRGDYASAERRLAWLIHKTADPAKVPDDLRWFHGLAAAHLAHYDDAISDFDTLLVRSRRRAHSDSVQQFVLRTAQYLYVLGVVEQKAGRADTARALYQQAAEEDAGLFMAHVHLADMYEAQGVLGAAAAERASAVNIAPDDARLCLDRGMTPYTSAPPRERESALTHGRNVNQRDARLAYVLGLTELALQPPDAARAALAHGTPLAPDR